MTVEERYARAIQSSHLEVTDRPNDVDVLVAAGWVREGLATALYRLHVEFERCDMRTIRRFAPNPAPERITSIPSQQERKEKVAEWHAAELQRVSEDYKQRLTAAKALALLTMQSLPGVRSALGAHAMKTATRLGYEGVDVMAIAGQTLDIWLDPNCPYCEGRGYNGGFDRPQIWCVGKGRCDRTGKRRPRGGLFGDFLLSDMQRKMARVDELLKRFTRATEQIRRINMPPGFTDARPRLTSEGIVYEFSRDGRTWTRWEVE